MRGPNRHNTLTCDASSNAATTTDKSACVASVSLSGALAFTNCTTLFAAAVGDGTNAHTPPCTPALLLVVAFVIASAGTLSAFFLRCASTALWPRASAGGATADEMQAAMDEASTAKKEKRKQKSASRSEIEKNQKRSTLTFFLS